MSKCAAGLFLLAALAGPATASETAPPVREGRSVASCAGEPLVCAVMKDGSSRATSECDARHDGAVSFIPGDCFDEE